MCVCVLVWFVIFINNECLISMIELIYLSLNSEDTESAMIGDSRFGSTYTEIGTIGDCQFVANAIIRPSSICYLMIVHTRWNLN